MTGTIIHHPAEDVTDQMSVPSNQVWPAAQAHEVDIQLLLDATDPTTHHGTHDEQMNGRCHCSGRGTCCPAEEQQVNHDQHPAPDQQDEWLSDRIIQLLLDVKERLTTM